MFLDGPDAKARNAMPVVFAGEKVRPDSGEAVPDISVSRPSKQGQVLEHEPFARMKLTSFRLKDQAHLHDLIAVGLLDAIWIERFPANWQTDCRSGLIIPMHERGIGQP